MLPLAAVVGRVGGAQEVGAQPGEGMRAAVKASVKAGWGFLSSVVA